jgi:hypothetical protein
MSAADFIARCKIYRRLQIFSNLLFLGAAAAFVVLSAWMERTGGCDSDWCRLVVLLTVTAIGWAVLHALNGRAILPE